MRLVIVNCLLLASVAIALPNGRDKRHFSYLKNIINSVLFERNQINIPSKTILETEPEYKLFRLPGFEDILIKVGPKKPMVEKIEFPDLQPVNLNAFGSVVGTKSAEETQAAVRDINNLLSTSILAEKQDEMMKQVIVPMFPTLNSGSSVITDSIGSFPVFDTIKPKRRKLIEPYERKMKFKEPIQQKYVYKKLDNNEPAMSYTAHNNPHVRVEETIEMKSKLPMCIKKRVHDVIMLGADSFQAGPVQAVFPIQDNPVVDISSSSVGFNPYMQNPFFPAIKPSVISEFRTSLKPSNLNPTKSHLINSRPLPLNFRRPTQLEVVNINAPKIHVNSQVVQENASTTNMDNKIKISQTLGPIPPQYIPHRSNEVFPVGSKLEKMNDQRNATINGSAQNNVSNGMIPSYVYKQVGPPQTPDTLKIDDKVKTNFKTHTNSNVNMPSNYYYVPPVINSEELKKQEGKLKEGGVHINTVTLNPQKVLTNLVLSSTTVAPKQNSLKENIQTTYKGKPIVVPDVKTNYVYQQKNADGSSISIKGGKTGVTVNVKDSKPKGRGDIPDE